MQNRHFSFIVHSKTNVGSLLAAETFLHQSSSNISLLRCSANIKQFSGCLGKWRYFIPNKKSRVLEVPLSGALDSKIRAAHFVSFLVKNTFFPYSCSSPFTQVCLKLQSMLQPLSLCVSGSIFLPQTVLQKFISLFSLLSPWLS